MKTLTLITLSLTLGVALTAVANPSDEDAAPLFKMSLQGQPSCHAKPFLQLAQMSAVDECMAKCEKELFSCRESGKDESECKTALAACQQACEEEG